MVGLARGPPTRPDKATREAYLIKLLQDPELFQEFVRTTDCGGVL